MGGGFLVFRSNETKILSISQASQNQVWVCSYACMRQVKTAKSDHRPAERPTAFGGSKSLSSQNHDAFSSLVINLFSDMIIAN